MKNKTFFYGFILCVLLMTGCGAKTDSGSERDNIFLAISQQMGEMVENAKKAKEEPYISEQQRGDIDEACADLFCYRRLTDTQKAVYQEVYQAILDRREIALSTLDLQELDEIWRYVMTDHPEIYATKGYESTEVKNSDKRLNLFFTAQYTLSPEEAVTKDSQIEAYVNTCLSGLQPGAGEYETVKYIYDYLIQQTSYDLQAEDNQNICSVMIGHASVCQGYAEATQYLLNRCGIEATVVTGTAYGSKHAWNLVKVDGEYYYVDTTWGDVDFQLSEGASLQNETNIVNYDYFMIDDLQLQKTHTIDAENGELPACNSQKDNYYIRENLLFEQFNPEVDNARLKGIFDQAIANGQNTVTLKCATDEVFDALSSYLFDENHVFEYHNKGDRISYAVDKNIGTIIIWIEPFSEG